jgi:hypothetical protein
MPIPQENLGCFFIWKSLNLLVVSAQALTTNLLYDVRQIIHNKQFVVGTSVPETRTKVLTTKIFYQDSRKTPSVYSSGDG